ncbi:MAG: HupE/UreJ family protein [Gemmatimonadetes bacterium]|nr:HupE/UreJ family protein [Gemmatimonadota bacterium]
MSSPLLSSLASYAELGVRHIISPDALDHLLFLLVLAAIYRRHDWRPALAVVTAFTVGHSLSLVLVTQAWLRPSIPLVEFLIPLTIVAASVENLWQQRRIVRGNHSRWRPVFATVFGLIHGAGFAGYLAALSVSDQWMPLIGFNLGIELGQLLVLAVAGGTLLLVDQLFHRLALMLAHRAPVASPGQALGFPWRLRVVSITVLLVAARVAATRWPVTS